MLPVLLSSSAEQGYCVVVVNILNTMRIGGKLHGPLSNSPTPMQYVKRQNCQKHVVSILSCAHSMSYVVTSHVILIICEPRHVLEVE